MFSSADNHFDYGADLLLFDKYLNTINGTYFTRREIDLIACVMEHLSNKKIAILLSISHRTVETHIRHILSKIAQCTRENIIEFVDNSGHTNLFHQYYLCLKTKLLFKKSLLRIGEGADDLHFNLTEASTNSDNEEHDERLIKQLQKDLKTCRIHLTFDSHLQADRYFLQSEKHSTVTASITLSLKAAAQDNVINLAKGYYLSFFKLLEKLVDSKKIRKIHEDFQSNFQNSDSFVNHTPTENNIRNKKGCINHLKWPVIGLIIAILIWTVVNQFYFRQAIASKKDTSTEPNLTAKKQIPTQTKKWNLPLHLDHYVARPQLSEKIWSIFRAQSDQSRVMIGLYGLGGIGKSTAAKMAIHAPQNHYKLHAWFNSETESILQSEYIGLGEKYQLFTDDITDTQKILRTQEWLDQQRHILLVYDNVQDVNMLSRYLPNKGHIIITSRNPNLPNALEVEVMTEQEALTLLNYLIPQTIADEHNRKKAIVLTKILGHLPLALSQAGAYIAVNRLIIDNYLDFYKTEKHTLLSDQTLPAMDQHESVYITWDMSIKDIEKNEQMTAIQKLFSFLSYSYSHKIPKLLLAQYLYGKTDNDAMVQLNQVLFVLHQYSLIKLTEHVSIHRLLQNWLNSKNKINDKARHLREMLNAISAIYPWKNKKTDDIAFLRLLLPHIESIYKHVQLLPTTPEVGMLLGDIHYFFADYYSSIGDYHASQNALHQALIIRQKHTPEDKVAIADIWYQLGKIERKLGHHQSSQQMLEKALSVQIKNFGPDHLKISYTLDHLGRVNRELGNYYNSKTLLEKALSIKRNFLNPEDIKVSYTLDHLGRVERLLGNYYASKKLLEQAYTIKKHYFGPKNIRTACTLGYLAQAEYSLGNYELSKKLLQQVLKTQEKHMSSEHIMRSYSLAALGRVALALGQYSLSESCLTQALKIQESYFQKDHIDMSFTLDYLGTLMCEQGNTDQAQHALNRARSIKEKTFGAAHVTVKCTDVLLAKCALKVGQYQYSKDTLKKALQVQENCYGKNHVRTSDASLYLGIIECTSGQKETAQTLIDNAMSTKRAHFGDNHLEIKKNIAFIHSRCADWIDTKHQCSTVK